jgi:two-component system chemotaxis response regulator CheB
MAKVIRVLIVDDSAAIRQLLTKILSLDPTIEVVGTANDPYIAREKIKQLDPDVITLDVEMPRMDGITFLEKLMRGHPMPVVMVSSLTQSGCDITLRALELGAVDFFPKPTIDMLGGVATGAEQIIHKVKAASIARISSPSGAGNSHVNVERLAIHQSNLGAAGFRLTNQIIAIGASTGGTEALKEVLTRLPSDSPGIVMVLHMPPGFTKSYADRLNNICAIDVREAEHGDKVIPGLALLAPGNRHMRIARSGAEHMIALSDDSPVNLHRPAVVC